MDARLMQTLVGGLTHIEDAAYQAYLTSDGVGEELRHARYHVEAAIRRAAMELDTAEAQTEVDPAPPVERFTLSGQPFAGGWRTITTPAR